MSKQKLCKNCENYFVQGNTFCPHCGQKSKDNPKISETKTLIVGPNSLEANFAIQGDNGELIAAGCYAAMTLSFDGLMTQEQQRTNGPL